jgi:hypothetical protein
LKAKILAFSFTLLGSWFHSLGAAEENARSPKVSNLLRGRTNKVPSKRNINTTGNFDISFILYYFIIIPSLFHQME